MEADQPDADASVKGWENGKEPEEEEEANASTGPPPAVEGFDRRAEVGAAQTTVGQGDSSGSDSDTLRATDGRSDEPALTPRSLPQLKRLKGKKFLRYRGSLRGKLDGGDDHSVSSSEGSDHSLGDSPRSNSQRTDSDASLLLPIPQSPVEPFDDQLGSPLANSAGIVGFASIKVGQNRRAVKEVSDLRLVQELKVHQGVVWTARFSPDGSLLASGGKDAVVYLWEVVSKRANKQKQSCRVDLPVFKQVPMRTWRGHQSDILDLTWSAESQFVLSASLDKVVRLWHITKDECLRQFQHQSWVTCIRFHPKDASKFISGGGDGVLRMWSVMERRVVASASVASEEDMYTALAFSQDAKMIASGTYKGMCRFYEMNGKRIEKRAQIDVRNRRGRHSKGKRITGMEYIPGQPSTLLVTSNDNRIRLIQGLKEVMKFKGHTNNTGLPISASHCLERGYIICGSEEGRVYIWNNSTKLGEDENAPKEEMPVHASVAREKINSYEWFRAHDGCATVALFAPDTCRRPFVDLDSVEDTPVVVQSSAHRLRRVLKHASQSSGSGHIATGEETMPSSQEVLDGGTGEGFGLFGQVIVTAGGDGEIRVWENFGFPVNLTS